MASQEISEVFEKLKKEGKIKSEMDAFIEGCIYQVGVDTDKTLETITKAFKGEDNE